MRRPGRGSEGAGRRWPRLRVALAAAVAVGAAGAVGRAQAPAASVGADTGAAGAAGAVRLIASPPLAVPSPEDPDSEPVAPLGPAAARDEAAAAPPPPVHRTTLRARLDADRHRVEGEGEVRWRNASSRPVDEVYWHLYLNAFKNSRTAFLRSRLGSGRGDASPEAWGEVVVKRLTVRRASEPAERAVDLALAPHSPGDPDDQTDLRAALPAPCAPGDELVFALTFESTLPSIVERTGHLGSFHMIGQWFPKLARLRPDGTWSHFPFVRLSEFDADFGDYDVTMDVPAGFEVGATGERREDTTAGGRRVVRHEQASVHDFAWTAWDGFRRTELEIEGVRVQVLAPPGHERAVARQLDGLRGAIPCMNRRLGRYPYRTLTVVQPPPGAGEAGGMEYPTLITTGGPWFGPPLVRSSEAVTVHEYGHQYFYGLLASDEHRWPFLDEGLNSYLEVACMREAYGDGSLVEMPGFELDLEGGERALSLTAGHDLAIAHAAGDYPVASHYGRLVYFRTSTLLTTLRRTHGPAVDEALARYARAYRFHHPGPQHLIAAFREVEPAMADALAEGLFRRGWIDVAVLGFEGSKARSAGGLFDGPTGRTTQAAAEQPDRFVGWAVVARRGTLRLPVEIKLRFADGSERRERWDGQGEWVRVEVESASELVGVEADPEHKLLLDEDFSNNALAARPQRLAASVLERASFWGGLLGHLLSP